MKKTSKRILSLLLAAMMVLSLFAGCGGKTSSASGSAQASDGYDPLIDNDETINLTVFSQLANWSGAQTGWGATLLKDMFKIEQTIIPDSDGTYETRMESGNLGDIVVWGSNGDEYKAAVDQGMLFDWEDEDLVATYGKDILAYFPNALEANRELNADGKIYGYGNGVASESGQHDLFIYDWGIRWDAYAAAGYPEVKDLDDFVEALKQMQQAVPTGDDGKTTYAASLWPDWDGNMVMYVKALAEGYYGYKELGIGLYDSANGDFYDCLEEDGPYLKSLKIMLPKDYVNYVLTGVHACDYSDASGMLLLDVEHKCWSTVESVLFSYFCIYNLGHEEWLSVLCIIASIASIAATAALPGIGRRTGKQTIIFLGCLSMIVSALFCMLATGFLSALLFVIFKGIGYGFCISCSGVLWATTSDHIEAETGVAIPGLVMAMGSFTCKILMGFCAFLGTQVLTLAHYDGELAAQSLRTLNWIRYGMVGFLLLAAVITIIANFMLRELHGLQVQESTAQSGRELR